RSSDPRVEIERGADRLAHLAERLQFADRTGELRGARLQLVEESDVLDGDSSLVGEGLQQRDLLTKEWIRLAAGSAPHDREGTQCAVLTHDRYREHAAIAGRASQLTHELGHLRVGCDVGDVNDLPSPDGPAHEGAAVRQAVV